VCDLLTAYKYTCNPTLLAANYVKRCTRTKFGERAFSFAGPAAWNNLPKDLQQYSNTVVFKKWLKTFLLQSAFVTD